MKNKKKAKPQVEKLFYYLIWTEGRCTRNYLKCPYGIFPTGRHTHFQGATDIESSPPHSPWVPLETLRVNVAAAIRHSRPAPAGIPEKAVSVSQMPRAICGE